MQFNKRQFLIEAVLSPEDPTLPATAESNAALLAEIARLQAQMTRLQLAERNISARRQSVPQPAGKGK